jgi:hypothetical protein
MQTTKFLKDEHVYAETNYGNGIIVVEKADPRILHDAPPTVAAGALIDVTFTMVDFDGALRTAANSDLLLHIDGTPLTLPVIAGMTTLPMQLFVSVTVEQQPPYLNDARMQPFTIEVDV